MIYIVRIVVSLYDIETSCFFEQIKKLTIRIGSQIINGTMIFDEKDLKKAVCRKPDEPDTDFFQKYMVISRAKGL